MGKKIEEAEVKKECPSCGLGVALDSTICEFCGWDFEEEDEWILQIEKLERDLMLEKQKFAPGTDESKIEVTIHTPSVVRTEMIRASQLKAKPVSAPAPKEPKFAPSPSVKTGRPAPVAGPGAKVRKVRPSGPEEELPEAFQESIKLSSGADASDGTSDEGAQQGQPQKFERVSVVRESTVPPGETAGTSGKEATPTRKTRTLRRVKK